MIARGRRSWNIWNRPFESGAFDVGHRHQRAVGDFDIDPAEGDVDHVRQDDTFFAFAGNVGDRQTVDGLGR